MKFKARTETECRPPLLPDGDYDALLCTAADEISKSGNEMIHFQLAVYSQTGRQHYVHDYLIDIDSMSYKIRHFCFSNGLQEYYDKETLNAEICLKVSNLRVRIKTQKSTDPNYSDKNIVSDYLMPLATDPKEKTQTDAEFFDDTVIPF